VQTNTHQQPRVSLFFQSTNMRNNYARFMHLCVRACVYVYVFLCMYACMCVCVFIYIYIYIYMLERMHACAYMHTHTHKHIPWRRTGHREASLPAVKAMHAQVYAHANICNMHRTNCGQQKTIKNVWRACANADAWIQIQTMMCKHQNTTIRQKSSSRLTALL
jgi:hypothetical protein